MGGIEWVADHCPQWEPKTGLGCGSLIYLGLTSCLLSKGFEVIYQIKRKHMIRKSKQETTKGPGRNRSFHSLRSAVSIGHDVGWVLQGTLWAV